MRNFFKKLIIPLILFSSLFGSVALASPAPPEVTGEGMILMDAKTGKILASKNGSKQFAPASTTKIMTALLVLENTKLTDVVTIGKNPPFAEGSSIGLKEGDQYTVNDLLHGLLLESANDCAVALAEHISGSESTFAKLMNERAKSLGAKNTNFVNSSGLFEDNHLTTPYDLSLIMDEVCKNKDFVKISKTKAYELPESKVDGFTKWTNNVNSLIDSGNSKFYKDLIAGKTGYTTKSQFTYIASAEKDNQELIVALFKYPNKASTFDDTINLFNYGFDNFNLVKLYNKGDKVSSVKVNRFTDVPLLASNDVYYVAENNKFNDANEIKQAMKPEFKLESKDLDRQNLNKGDVLLDSDLYLGEAVYTSVSLESGVNVQYGFLDKFLNNLSDYKYVYIVITIIFAIIIFIGSIRYRNLSKKGFSFRRKKQLFGKRKNKYD